MSFTPKKIYGSGTPGQAPSSGSELVKNFNDNFDAVKSDLDEKDKKIVQLEQGESIYNVTTKHPLPSGSYYTTATARAAVPDSVRKSGLIITYKINASNTWITESFFRGSISQWDNDTCWKKIITDGNIFLKYTTSVADTRLLIPIQDRKQGLLISYYKDNSLVTEQYWSAVLDDAQWVVDSNWITLAKQSSVSNLEQITTQQSNNIAIVKESTDRTDEIYFNSRIPTFTDFMSGVSIAKNNFVFSDGSIRPSNDYNVSDFIPVSSGTTIVVASNKVNVNLLGYFYNSEKTPISSIGGQGLSNSTFTPPSNGFVRINFFKTTQSVITTKQDYDAGVAGKYKVPSLDYIDSKQVDEKLEISGRDKATKVELSNKLDRVFKTVGEYNTSAQAPNASFPIWPSDNKQADFLFIRAGFVASNEVCIRKISIAGAYITTDVAIGSGNLCVRVYSEDLCLNPNTDITSKFSQATLLSKGTISIADFYKNSTKGVTKEELATKLNNKEYGFSEIDIPAITVKKGQKIWVVFGVDDDKYYVDNPPNTKPSCRFSIVTAQTVVNPYLSNPGKPTFKTASNSAESLFLNDSAIIQIKIDISNEVTLVKETAYAITTRDKFTFAGAFNFVLDELFKVKPLSRIAMIGHNTLAGKEPKSGTHYKQLVDVQQMIARYWGCHYIALWKVLNWINNPPTNTFKIWCPDEIHPYTNATKVTTSIGQMSIADYIIHDHIKAWLKPIFGDNWSGKKVACYGTSIPYGGKYIDLAVRELGGVISNRCESGSVIRAGKTNGTPHQHGMFSVIDDAHRNYQKDMLSLINTSDEPDLFIFDFGINDYELDSSDFDIS